MELLIVWAIGIALLIASGFRKKTPVAAAPPVHKAAADKAVTSIRPPTIVGLRNLVPPGDVRLCAPCARRARPGFCKSSAGACKTRLLAGDVRMILELQLSKGRQAGAQISSQRRIAGMMNGVVQPGLGNLQIAAQRRRGNLQRFRRGVLRQPAEND